MGYEAVGRLDARLEIVADWKEPFREGVVYYLGEGRVRGVLLWNVWGQVDAARELIAAARAAAAGGPARANRIALHRRVAGERPSAMSVADRTKVDSK